ncbi:MAG: glycerol-3-phosphate dehydrogenase/oxidase [Gammaproteobacteria bacterium]
MTLSDRAQKRREDIIGKLTDREFDVVVIGAGINGAASAAALAAGGARVALIDKADFAGNTSSNSSSLVWGGIKYLENHEYRLVNKLCKGRNELREAFPTTVQEVRFLTTIRQGFRMPVWFVYLGTWLYWLFGRFATRRPHYLRTSQIHRREPLIKTDDAVGGFEYSDCYLPDGDARFVWRFVQQCQRHGGVAANYMAVDRAERVGDMWHLSARDHVADQPLSIKARLVVNACGPEVDALNMVVGQQTRFRHVFSKGVHLIVRRLTKDERVLTFFASDGRMFFVFPKGSRSCIGTTDTQVSTPYVGVTDEDRDFILDNINNLLSLSEPLTRDDVIAERCGVRPLVTKGGAGEGTAADWLQLSRKHEIHCNEEEQYISIFGGKLTDCLNVGDEITSLVSQCGLNVGHANRGGLGEPGLKIKSEFDQFALDNGLDEHTASNSRGPLSVRLWRRYGLAAKGIAEDILAAPDKARTLFANSSFTWAELEYSAANEMIESIDDLFRRRSSIALVVPWDERTQSETLLKVAEVLFDDRASEYVAQYLALDGDSAVEA